MNPETWFDCKLSKYLFNISYHSSSTFLVIMTVEKWFSLYFPLKARLFCTVKIAKRISLITVLVFALYNIPLLFIYETGDRNNCIINISEFYNMILYLIDALINAYVPFVVMIMCNTAIIVKLRSKKKTTGKGLSKAGKQATIMLLCVTFVFIILTFPVNIYFQIAGSALDSKPIVLVICANMFFVNSSVNALLYMSSGSKYREGLRKTFRCFRKNKVSGSVASSTKPDVQVILNSTNEHNLSQP